MSNALKHTNNPKAKGIEHKSSPDGTRERILKAAFTEFASRGFSGARMEAIAKRAKANKAMIHYYFGSKQELYQKLLLQTFGFNILEEQLGKEFAQWPLSIPQRLYVVLFVLTSIHIGRNSPKQSAMYRLLAWENAEGKNRLHFLTESFIIPRLRLVESLIQAGIQQGVFVCENSLLMIHGMISRITFYEIQRDLFRGTDFYNDLYIKVSQEDFFNYLISSVFRELSPPKKPLEIPVIPDLIMNRVQELVKVIRETSSSFV